MRAGAGILVAAAAFALLCLASVLVPLGAGVQVEQPTPRPTVTKYIHIQEQSFRHPSHRHRARLLGAHAVGRRGWGLRQFDCLRALWNRESGWNRHADNPTSTAYGIAQFLDATWKGTGIRKTSNARLQIKAGLRYIHSRYGKPCAAWRHSLERGWY